MNYIKQFRTLLAVVVLVGMVACASLATPDTFSQRLAYAYGSLAAVRQSTADLVIAKRVTAAEGSTVLEKTDATRVVLDAARSAYADKDVSTAESRLATAQQFLTTLQDWLKSKGGNAQ